MQTRLVLVTIANVIKGRGVMSSIEYIDDWFQFTVLKKYFFCVQIAVGVAGFRMDAAKHVWPKVN